MGVRSLLTRDLGALIRDFGEEVIYHPAAGEDRTFQAVVQRAEPKRQFSSSSGAQAHVVTVLMRRSADPTVGVEALTVPGDQITLPMRDGETAVRVRVLALVSSNPGFFRIRVAR